MTSLLPDRLLGTRIISKESPIAFATIIYAKNALDFIDEVQKDTSILVNIAPPLDNLFVQFPVKVQGNVTFELGIHLLYRRVSDVESGVEWLLDATLWGEPNMHRVIGSEPVMSWFLTVDATGKCMTLDVNSESQFFDANHIEDKEKAINHFKRLLAAALFAVNLMHCKNVILEKQPLSKRERRMAEKHGKQAFRYHLLKVRSARKVYELGGAGSGQEYSTHICRGHFKTFTDEAPLFGKFVGIYWWDSQVRGRSKSVVDKDYVVEDGELA